MFMKLNKSKSRWSKYSFSKFFQSIIVSTSTIEGKANETVKHQALQPKCAAVVASSPMRKISALSNADMKALGNEVNNAARNANNTELYPSRPDTLLSHGQSTVVDHVWMCFSYSFKSTSMKGRKECVAPVLHETELKKNLKKVVHSQTKPDASGHQTFRQRKGTNALSNLNVRACLATEWSVLLSYLQKTKSRPE